MDRWAADALLFDLDGTLVDESDSYREAIRLTAEYMLRRPVSAAEVETVKRVPGFNNDWDATWALVGYRLHGRLRQLTPADRGSQAFRRLQDAFQTYYLGDHLWREIGGREPPFSWREPLMMRETRLIDARTLDWLTEFPLGIATSRPRAEALMALRQHGLERHFPAHLVVASGDTTREKPHPEPLSVLARRLGCRRPVYIGDTINDAIAAREAGMAFIQIGSAPFGDAAVDGWISYRVAGVNDIAALGLQRPVAGGVPGSRS